MLRRTLAGAMITAVAAGLVPAPAAADVAPQGRAFGATAGQAFTGTVADFSSDAQSSAGNFSATIDWGDATPPSAGTIRATGCDANVQASFCGYAVEGTHTYAAAGSYTVRVTIRDARDNQASDAVSRADVAGAAEQPPPPQEPARNEQPVAVLAFQPGSPMSGTSVRFDASGSRPSDGAAITSIKFDTNGNGSFDTDCEAASAAATYSTGGSHSAAVLVTDSAGKSSIATVSFTVAGPAATGKGPPPATGYCNRGGGEIAPGGFGLSGPDISKALCARTLAFGFAEASARGGCLEPVEGEPDVFRSPTAAVVRVNGLDVRPAPGIHLRFDKRALRITSAGGVLGNNPAVATVKGPFGVSIPFQALKTLTWDVSRATTIQTFDLGKGAALLGLGVQGTVKFVLTYRGAEIPINIGLPGLFKDPTTGKGATGDARLKTDNTAGLRLEDLRLLAPRIMLGALEVRPLSLEYFRSENLWRGKATLIFPTGTKLDATADIRNGAFDNATGNLTFGPPSLPLGLPVFSSVYLNEIGFGVFTRPTRINGSAKLTAGSISGKSLARIDGTVGIAFATPAEPCVGCALGRTYTTTMFHVGGTLTLVDRVQLASAYGLYVAPSYFELAGNVDYALIPGWVAVQANVLVAANLAKSAFNAEAGARVCVNFKVKSGCFGGAAILSSRGMGGCIYTFLADVGGGIYWSGGYKLFWRSCDIGAFRANLARTSQEGATRRTITVGPGAHKAVEIQGTSSAPEVVLTGPGGERAETPTDGMLNDRRFTILQNPAAKSTYVVISKDLPGEWTISLAPGSAPIAKVLEGEVLPQPLVRARLAGTARRRVLRYTVDRVAGQTVRFFERGPQTMSPIGTARGPRGTLRFTVARGPQGPRQVVAAVENGGLTRKTIVVARFRAPAPARPGRPRAVRVTRRGTRLLVTWKSAANVHRYAVGVEVSDGRRLLFFTPARRRSLLVRGVARSVSATVRVAGVSIENWFGPRVKAKVSPLRKRAARRRR